MSLPPVFAASALYDSLLQGALRQFFGRATFETEPIPSLSSDGRLAIEPTSDPSVLSVRWFGSRHVLHVPARRPFTAHEVRLARAIGAVLAARYRAIFDPRQMLERGELFGGAIEDRYVGAFLDDSPYGASQGPPRADRIASAIEVMRVAALSSYENRPISTGVLLLGTLEDPVSPHPTRPPGSHLYSQALTGVKSFFRLVDGLRTLFVVGSDGMLLDIVDVQDWAYRASGGGPLSAPCPAAYEAHARATLHNGHVCLVLSPSHEIKVFAEGAQVLAYRHASWALLDLSRKYEMWAAAVGNDALASRLFQSALDLADAREGALFVVLRDPSTSVENLLSLPDRIDIGLTDVGNLQAPPTRRDLLYLLTGRTVTELEPTVLAALASIDGAMVTDRAGNLIGIGAILRHPYTTPVAEDAIIEGARSTAAMTASRFGPVLKVSEDGGITFFDGGKVWDI